MKLRFCSCRMCRYGRKKYGNPQMITHLKRANRHKVKQMLKRGKYEELQTAISIPFTD